MRRITRGTTIRAALTLIVVALTVVALTVVAPAAVALPDPAGAAAAAPGRAVPSDGVTPIDAAATPQTLALYRNLAAFSGNGLLFGHQDDLAYGNTWSAEPGRSDVREAAGAYPAVFGWDVGRIELAAQQNIDGVDFTALKGWIRQAYEMGAVNTVSWHSVDPVTGGGYGSTPTPRAISYVLPGGPQHDTLLRWLDRFAAFDADLVDAAGRPIPIVFRPYHEHSGDWFWWGLDNGLNTVADYTALWRFTVEYLRDRKGLHNLIYAISPDRSRMDVTDLTREYLDIYPGDDVVDVLGIDNYWDTGHRANTTPRAQQFDNYVTSLRTVARLARERGKLAALTETGTVTDTDRPWTDYLLRAATTDADTRRIAWALVWRNPYGGSGGGSPRPGSRTAPDFASFARDGFTVFADTLPALYTTGPATATPSDR